MIEPTRPYNREMVVGKAFRKVVTTLLKTVTVLLTTPVLVSSTVLEPWTGVERVVVCYR